MRWADEGDGVGAIEALGMGGPPKQYVELYKATLAAQAAEPVTTLTKETAPTYATTAIVAAPTAPVEPAPTRSMWDPIIKALAAKAADTTVVEVPPETLEALKTVAPEEKVAIEAEIIKTPSFQISPIERALPQTTSTVWRGEKPAPAKMPSVLPAISIPGLGQKIPLTYVLIGAGVLLLIWKGRK